MAREPSYPDDEPVEPDTAGEEQITGAKTAGSNRTRKIVTGAAIGIGSAALVAALLYANRSRKDGGSEDK